MKSDEHKRALALARVKRYQQTAKGKASMLRYKRSAKGKAKDARYAASEKGIANQQRNANKNYVPHPRKRDQSRKMRDQLIPHEKPQRPITSMG
jgi:hypothetical protein